jgi:hypothetical protein
MSDSVIYDLSSTNSVDERPFIHKDWAYVNDQNNGSYSSGQVILSTESLSNSGKWCNYQEAYLRVPLIVVVDAKRADGTTNIPLDTVVASEFMVGLKNGYWNLIHSMVVEYNNSPAIQSTAYTNVYNCFKANTSYSLDDVQTVGPSVGYHPDSETSWGFNPAPSGMGIGSCNNSNWDTNFNGAVSYGTNSVANGNAGFIKRQLNDNMVFGDNGADTFEKLQQKLEVGTGCSSCVSEVNEILTCKKKVKP